MVVMSDGVARGLRLWITKPSAYNKNVGSTEFLCVDINQSPDPLDIVETFFKGLLCGKTFSVGAVRSSLHSRLSEHGLSVEGEPDPNVANRKWLIIRFNIPKNGFFRWSSIDLVIWDLSCAVIEFRTLDATSLEFSPSYTLSFDGQNVIFTPWGDSQQLLRTKELFFHKLGKWSESTYESHGPKSLSLVPHEEYAVLYNNLKRKYCESIRNIWQESTDPDKFIHEDVAIATYLIILWGRQRQTFVDLGCGNGLLVHILCSEGHEGRGIDVRARKIWSRYPEGTRLEVGTIKPSLSTTFPDVDWIIGNHSDELTPWIPVISLISSARTNFFLLPCCAFEFSGVKYKRSSSSKSQYMDYLDYVENLCVECGFRVFRDRLKIPSTKRICFISRGRTELPGSAVQRAQSVIEKRAAEVSASTVVVDDWLSGVKTREPVEKVRNCTQLDKKFVSSLLSTVAHLLLADAPLGSSWFAGNPLDITEVALKVPKEDLKRMKNECGGLQTFFRNHKFIFAIAEGKVSFRKPEPLAERPKSWKTKLCWFYANHPQSCPLSDDICSFIHAGNSPS